MLWLTLLYLYNLVGATWYTNEAKVCDPANTNFIPFTGFKISRIYKLAGFQPQSMSFLSFSHCDHGKKDYEFVTTTPRSSDIDWNSLFCVFKPHDDFGVKKGEATKKSLTLKGIQELVRNLIDKGAEKLTDGTYLEYTGKRKATHLEQVRKSDPQAALEWESRNLKCFKLARRKKYARRNVSFYMPQTFVGGLFECQLSTTQRREFFEKFSATDFIHPFNFVCDKAMAVPILPLIADDSTKIWFQTGTDGFNPYILQTIPYLTTAGPLNLRFKSSDTPDMFRETWASKIDVNEEYSYSEPDLHFISLAVAMTTDYLNKVFAPLDIEPILRALDIDTPVSDRLENPRMETTDHLLLMQFSTLNTSTVMKHLQKIQHIWNNNID